jgi:EpsI family protein
MAALFHSKSVRILSLVLIAQAGVFYGFSRRENVPLSRPLADFTLTGTPWKSIEEVQIDPETLEVLKADDILSRLYQDKENGQVASLFVAYFATQRTGKAPHSPKNCLPGAGWTPTQQGMIDISVPDEAQPIRVNQYVVAHGENQSVVLYWYQARNRVIASEYSAKLFTVADAIRYNRSDTSLVRVVVGADSGNTQRAIDGATAFVKAFFAPLKQYLPS